MRITRERQVRSVRNQVSEEIENATLIGLTYDAARDADEEWYAKEHSNGPTEAEGILWKTLETKVPDDMLTKADGPERRKVFKAAVPFTTRQLWMLFRTKQEIETDMKPKPPEASPSSSTMPLGVSAAEITGLTGLQPLVWNAEFARQLLHEHLQALKDMQKDQTTHKKGVFLTDVAGALGTDAEEAVKQLLPTFRALCEYRSTMLRVKQMELEQSQQLQLVTDAKGAQADKEALDELKQLTAERSQWKIYAQRLIDAERGRLPGSSTFRSPTFCRCASRRRRASASRRARCSWRAWRAGLG